MKRIWKVGKRLAAAALALTLLVCLGACGKSDEEEEELVGTWDAYYIIVDGESEGLDKGDMRLDLTNKGTFNLASMGDVISGDWSYDGKSLSLDYGGGNVVEMSVSLISDTEMTTRVEDVDMLASWRRR